jgi:uncharacterized membrane protein YagU involved in acid resistance
MSATSGGFLFRGIVAGAIGAWVMDRATWAIQDRQPRRSIKRERAAWPDHLDVSHLLAYRLARAAGAPVTRGHPSTPGMVTHYLLGIGPAILYAFIRERNTRASVDRGLLYGFTIFALWDEALSFTTGIAA